MFSLPRSCNAPLFLLSLSLLGLACGGEDPSASQTQAPKSSAGKKGNTGKAGAGGSAASSLDVGGSGVDCGSQDGKANLQGCPCDMGQSRSCFAGDPKLAGVGVCKLGTQSCVPGEKTQGEVGPVNEWGPCLGSGEPQAEVCDDIDQNCNGDSKEGCACQNGVTEGCMAGEQAGQRTCLGGQWGACAPMQTAVCSEGQSRECALQASPPGVETCVGGQWGPCTVPPCISGQTVDCSFASGLVGTAMCVGTKWGPCVKKKACEEGETQNCTDASGQPGVLLCVNGAWWGTCEVKCTGEPPEGCTATNGLPGTPICTGGQWSCQPSQTSVCPLGQNYDCTCTEGAIQSCDKDTSRTCEGGKWGACKANPPPPTLYTPCATGSVLLGCPSQEALTGGITPYVTECDGGQWHCIPNSGCAPALCQDCLLNKCAEKLISPDPACQTLLSVAADWLMHCGADRAAYWQQLTSDPACKNGEVNALFGCKTGCQSPFAGPCNLYLWGLLSRHPARKERQIRPVTPGPSLLFTLGGSEAWLPGWNLLVGAPDRPRGRRAGPSTPRTRTGPAAGVINPFHEQARGPLE